MDEIEISSNLRDYCTYDYSNCDVACLDNNNLKYEYFLENFMLRNMPCIIQNVSVNWDCSRNWVQNDLINYDYFISQYGELEAPVADCNKINFNAHCKRHMQVKDFMSYLKYGTDELLYLKDWHLKRTKPDHRFYEVPRIFGSDWLNEFAEDNKEDDFMFVYIGPKQSWTPLHSDVYTSYSWSVNVVGRKKWILLPPGEENKLKDRFGNLPLFFNPLESTSVKYFEVIQDKGDAIFVPSGWFHQVVNIHDTVSINHNFINACNLEFVWEALKKNLLSVEKEIQEFNNTPEYIVQCQLILKSVFGMDYATFINFITHIGNKRIRQFHGENLLSFHKFTFGINHLTFDLYKILKLLLLIQQHPLYETAYCTPTIKENVSEIIKAIKRMQN